MAYLENRNGNFRIVFRLAGNQIKHKLGKIDPREADGCLARLEENMRLIDRGRLAIPPDADPALFLLFDGRIEAKAKALEALTLDGLRESFLAANTDSMEANSLSTSRVHFKNLMGTFGPTFDVRRLELTDLERHVARRSKMKGWKGRPLTAVTIKKEVQTFSAAWNWAARRKLVNRPFPSLGLVYPKTSEKAPFRTRAEIEASIGRGLSSVEMGAV